MAEAGPPLDRELEVGAGVLMGWLAEEDPKQHGPEALPLALGFGLRGGDGALALEFSV